MDQQTQDQQTQQVQATQVQPTVQLVKGPGTTLMKVPGILMIIFSAIGLIMTLVVRGFLALAGAVVERHSEISRAVGSIGNAYTLAIIASLLTVAAGIVAIASARKLGRAMPAIVLSGLVIVLSIVQTVMFVGATQRLVEAIRQIPDATLEVPGFGAGNIIGLLASLVLPVLVVIGGLKNNRVI